METILMSASDRKRLEVLSRVERGEMRLVEAAEYLGLSYRQTKRVWSRYQREGAGGVAHRARGRSSNRQSASAKKEQALALYRQEYGDYGPTLAVECLASEHGLEVSVSTFRRWLMSARLWERKRKRRVHRRRRERRSHVGELVQMDGSHHDWFEGRRAQSQAPEAYAGWAVLMVMIDDASSRVFARFYENESWHSAADVFRQYVASHGLPRGLYVDRHGIYRAEREATGEEILADQAPQTQFGRAMGELEVELILARSPQAKGRVERMNGTLQDRLVKALRRANIGELPSANAYLAETFLPDLNARFSRPAAQAGDWHRPVASSLDLSRVLSIQEPRVVQNDWTVRWRHRILQLSPETATLVVPGQTVTVCEGLTGELRVFAGEVCLAWSGTRTTPPVRRGKTRSGPTGSSQGQKPRPDHPWRGVGREMSNA